MKLHAIKIQKTLELEIEHIFIDLLLKLKYFMRRNSIYDELVRLSMIEVKFEPFFLPKCSSTHLRY